MPTSLVAGVLVDEDPDLLIGRDLVACWAGREFSDEEDFRKTRKRFYAAADAGQVPVAKRPGIGWIGRRSLIQQHRRDLLEMVDREARERCGMAPPAA
jgi:hypothetical protein